MERVNSRAVVGHIEHPSDGLPDLRKAAVVLTDVGFVDDFPGLREEMIKQGESDPDTCVIGRFEALSTPDGKIVEALWLDEVQTGASSRAQGSVVKNESRLYPQYPDGADVVQEDIDEETLTWDIVARPSTPGAFPKRVQEAINEAIEHYRRESLLEVETLNPPIGRGVGGNTMNLTEVRTRLSRIKPAMQDLHRVPRRNLLRYMQEVNTLLEDLNSASRSLNESQQIPAADMRGELMALRDKLMASIGSAFTEASDRIPGSQPVRVSGQGGNLGSTDPAVLNADPYLPGLDPHQQQPGGPSGIPVPQSRVPGERVGDQSVPGPGIKPGVQASNAAHQDDGSNEAHGEQIGQSTGADNEGVSGKSISDKKKRTVGTGADAMSGYKGESITTDDAHRTGTGDKAVQGSVPMVRQDEEGEGMEVSQAGGKQWRSSGLDAGEEGDASGDKMQGVAPNMRGKAKTSKAQVEGVGAMGGGQLSEGSVASLNLELVNECNALRRENTYWRQRAQHAESLAVETGKQYRVERRNMVMERLIENNPVLNDAKTRKVLETAQNEAHMIQMAEAIIGGRVRVDKSRERTLTVAMESDGSYRLFIDRKPYNRKFDGGTLWEALSKMGVHDKQIAANFDRAHRRALREDDWEIPDDVEYEGGTDEEGEMIPPIAIIPGDQGGPAQVVTMQKSDEYGAGDDEDMDMDMDMDVDFEGGEEEDDLDAEFDELDLDDEGEDEDFDFYDEDEDFEESCDYGSDKKKKKKKKSKRGRREESRRPRRRRRLTEAEKALASEIEKYLMNNPGVPASVDDIATDLGEDEISVINAVTHLASDPSSNVTRKGRQFMAEPTNVIGMRRGGGEKGAPKMQSTGGIPFQAESKGSKKYLRYMESRGLVRGKKSRGKRALNESRSRSRRPAKRGTRPGARRLQESLPPKGGRPTRNVPNMRESQSSAPQSLMEKVIARKAEEQRIAEERRAEAKRNQRLNG